MHVKLEEVQEGKRPVAAAADESRRNYNCLSLELILVER